MFRQRSPESRNLDLLLSRPAPWPGRLITPGIGRRPPTVKKKVTGANAAAGELRMLFVGTDIWKMSRLLPEDLALETTPEMQDRVGYLITEVVMPEFHWEDHEFLTREKLDVLFDGVEGREGKIRLLAPYVKKSE